MTPLQDAQKAPRARDRAAPFCRQRRAWYKGRVESNAAQYIVAACVIIRRGDTILAMRRSMSKDAGPGLWEAISGRVEVGEEPLDAARREVAEETGLSVRIDPRPVTAYAATRLGVPMVVVVYQAAYEGGSVRTSAEHDDFAWVTADEFADRSSLTKLVDAVARTLRDPAFPSGRDLDGIR